jgi:DNA primase
MPLAARRTSEQLIQTVRERSDIVSVVSGFVALKKTGLNYVGLCPFHAEKTPSFSVSPSKQIFHCFGCGFGGDVFRFLMQVEGITFPQALKQLAGRAGIALPDRFSASSQSTEADAEREALVRINQAAAAYYHRNLKERPEGKAARDYLSARKIDRETLDGFQIGYALPAWDGLIRHLGERFSVRLLEKAGLIIRGDHPGHYDRFRGRLIFPIKNLQGEVIAFGGRVLNGDQPKYLNSPETPLYTKGKHLFALDRARGSREKTLVLVEGYFDAIAAHQAGIQNAVATLGTALTPDHLYLLKRLCEKVVVIFDPDAAGRRAAVRAAGLFSEAGLPADTVLLPDGEDPDLFIRKRGTESFLEAISRGTPLMEFALQQLIEGSQKGPIDAKMKALEEAFPLVQRIPSNIGKSHYLRWLSDRLNLPEEALRREFSGLKRTSPSGGHTAPAPSPEAPPPKEETMLVHLMVQRPERTKDMEGVDPNDFSDPRTRRIFQHLIDPNTPPPDTGEPGHSLYTELLVQEAVYDDPEKTFRDCLGTLRNRKLKEDARKVGEEIRSAELSGDWDRIKALQKQLYSIKQRILK